MNRRVNDPDGSDYSKMRTKCIDHSNQLKDIWLTLRGNGHPEDGISFKVAKIEDRQGEILEFVKQVKGVFWKTLPLALGGSVSAILMLVWQVVKLLFKHGQL